jgi:hypothetical protein
MSEDPSPKNLKRKITVKLNIKLMKVNIKPTFLELHPLIKTNPNQTSNITIKWELKYATQNPSIWILVNTKRSK